MKTSIKTKKVKAAGGPRSWAIYGKSGSGKTTLACSFPKPMLLVDIQDKGTDSVSDVEGVHVLEKEIECWQDLEDIYWYLKENPQGFKTVAFDTITQAQQILMEEIGGNKAASKGKQVTDWGVLTRQDYGTIASIMKTWITNVRNLPIEVIFIAQDRIFNLEDDEAVDETMDPEVGPRLTPSVNKHLCAAVHVIGNTLVREKSYTVKVKGKEKEKTKQEYSIRLGPNPYYITKLRKPKDIVLPDFLDDPTYEEILEIIKGE